MHVLQVVLLLLGVWATGLPIMLAVLRRRTVNGALMLGLSFVTGNCVLLSANTIAVVLGAPSLVLPIWIAISVSGALSTAALLATRVVLLKFGIRDLSLIIAALLVFAPVCFWGSTQVGNAPDAKAMWLYRAKAVIAGEPAIVAHYTNDAYVYSHRDYPIGFSSGLAVFMQLQPEPSEHLAAPYATSFLLAALLIVGGLLLHVLPRSRMAPALAVIAFGGVPALQSQASTFYADVPLAAVFCAALACLVLILEATDASDKRAWFFLSVSAAATGLLVKNEGLPMFVLIIVAGALLVAPRRVQTAVRLLVVPLITAIPLFFWLWFKARFHIKGYTIEPPYIQQAVVQPLNHRAWVTWNSIAPNIANFAYWGWSLLPVMLAGAGAAVAAFMSSKKARVLLPAVVLAAQAATYAGVYMFSHYEVSWLIATSIDRVLVQLYPASWVVAIWYLAYVVRGRTTPVRSA